MSCVVASGGSKVRNDDGVVADATACAACAERCGFGIGHLPRRHGNQFCAVLVADVGCLAIGRRQERQPMESICCCCCCCGRWCGAHRASRGHGGAGKISGVTAEGGGEGGEGSVNGLVCVEQS